jgi:steroid delta-isomerase-like uncharacterized protein
MIEENKHFDSAAAKALLSQFIQEVWNEGNINAADKYIATGYTLYHDPGDPWDKRELDLEEYKERFRLSRAPFPDQRFTLKEMFADNNAVIVTWLWSGTHLGDLPGFPASGKKIAMSGITVYYMNGDQFTGHWQVIDRLGVYQQLLQSSVK